MIKKYNDFIQGMNNRNDLNESMMSNLDIIMHNSDNINDFIKNAIDEYPNLSDSEDWLRKIYLNRSDEINDIDDTEINTEPLEGEEEEEVGEYQGKKLMQELSKMLQSDIVDNSINYDGYKINFYSETENFHVKKEGERSKKFKTPEEVVSFLEGMIKNHKKYRIL